MTNLLQHSSGATVAFIREQENGSYLYTILSVESGADAARLLYHIKKSIEKHETTFKDNKLEKEQNSFLIADNFYLTVDNIWSSFNKINWCIHQKGKSFIKTGFTNFLPYYPVSIVVDLSEKEIKVFDENYNSIDPFDNSSFFGEHHGKEIRDFFAKHKYSLIIENDKNAEQNTKDATDNYFKILEIF